MQEEAAAPAGGGLAPEERLGPALRKQTGSALVYSRPLSSNPTFDEVAGEGDRAMGRMEEMQKRWDRDARRAIKSICPDC